MLRESVCRPVQLSNTKHCPGNDEVTVRLWLLMSFTKIKVQKHRMFQCISININSEIPQTSVVGAVESHKVLPWSGSLRSFFFAFLYNSFPILSLFCKPSCMILQQHTYTVPVHLMSHLYEFKAIKSPGSAAERVKTNRQEQLRFSVSLNQLEFTESVLQHVWTTI